MFHQPTKAMHNVDLTEHTEQTLQQPTSTCQPIALVATVALAPEWAKSIAAPRVWRAAKLAFLALVNI